MKRLLISLVLAALACPAFAAIAVDCSEEKPDSGTSVSKGHPACLSDNDLIIFAIAKDDDIAITSDNGLTQAVQFNTTGDDQALAVFYRFVTNVAGEPDPYEFTQDNERMAFCVFVLTGVDATTPFDNVVPSQVERIDDASPSIPGVTTKSNNAVVFSFIVTTEDTEDSYGVPSGMASLRDPGGSEASQFPGGASCHITTVDQATAGASGDKEWTSVGSSDDTLGTVFSIRADGEAQVGSRRHLNIVIGLAGGAE